VGPGLDPELRSNFCASFGGAESLCWPTRPIYSREYREEIAQVVLSKSL